MRYRRYLLIAILVLSVSAIVTFIFRSTRKDSSTLDDAGLGTAPHESDGRGTATVHPSEPVRVSQRGTWTITYVADSTGITTGGGIVFQVSPFWYWSQPQSFEPDYPGYTTVSSNNQDVRCDLQGSNVHYLLLVCSEGQRTAGDTVQTIYDDSDGGNHPGGTAIRDR